MPIRREKTLDILNNIGGLRNATLVAAKVVTAGLALSWICLPVVAQQCSQISLNLELVPLKKSGDCPIGFYEESQYCVPNDGQRQAAVRQVNGQCPFQFQASGNYCLAPIAYANFVIEQISDSCPRGWVQQQGFCVKECPPLQLELRNTILQRLSNVQGPN